MSSTKADGSRPNNVDDAAQQQQPSSDEKQPDPGLIWVASGITRPDALPAAKFAAWYEDIHIDEVLGTGGVPAAARYVSLRARPEADPSSLRHRDVGAGMDAKKQDANEGERAAAVDGVLELDAPWLTVYEMPSVSYRETAAFKGLDGQKKPRGDGLQEIFSKAVFATRFSRLLYLRSEYGAPWGPADYVVTATLRIPVEGAELQQKDCVEYGRKLHSRIEGLPGLARIRIVEVVGSTVLEEFDRRLGREGVQVLVEFKEGVDWDKMADAFRTKDGLVELGMYKLTRVYGEFKTA